jgi:hypothetical protein
MTFHRNAFVITYIGKQTCKGPFNCLFYHTDPYIRAPQDYFTFFVTFQVTQRANMHGNEPLCYVLEKQFLRLTI